MSDYSRGDYADLPAGTTDLENNYSAPDLTAIASNDNSTYADQTANNEIAIHQYKKTVIGQYTNITWSGKSSLAPSESPVILEVYNVTGTPAWEELDRDDSTAADTDFDIIYNNLATADYLDSGVITWRVYQAASAPPSTGWTFPDNEIDITALITYGAAWNAVDLSTVVPAGTKLVQLHIRNSGGSGYVVEAKITGDTYDFSSFGHSSLGASAHTYKIVALDGSRIFSGWFANAALLVGITAYSSSGSGINKVNVSPTVADAYTTEDVSASIPAGNTVAFLDNVRLERAASFRATGSSLDPNSVYAAWPIYSSITGISTAREYDYKVASGYNADESLFLAGYDDQIIQLDDKTGLAASTLGSWEAHSCSGIVPAGAVAALIYLNVTQNDGGFYAAVRKKAASPDNIITSINVGSGSGVTLLVGLDASLEFETYTNEGYLDYYVLGYVPA